MKRRSAHAESCISTLHSHHIAAFQNRFLRMQHHVQRLSDDHRLKTTSRCEIAG